MGAIFKPLITITDANRRPVGAIRADTWGLGRNRSSFYVGDNRVGGLSETSWLSSTHKVTDGDKREIAEIVKREFGNNPLPDIPADGDSYWLHRPQRVSELHGTLVLLPAFAVDHAFNPPACLRTGRSAPDTAGRSASLAWQLQRDDDARPPAVSSGDGPSAV